MRPAAPFRRLRPRDVVAVLAPASPPAPNRVAAGLQVLRGWDWEPVVLPSVTATHPVLPQLAGQDDLRAADLVTAWRDPQVAAIWCVQGGYGVQRILDALPTDLFATGPGKPIVGFSDVTPLLHRALTGSGLQMIHGPMVAELGESSAEVLEHLHSLLVDPAGSRVLLTGLRPWTADGDTDGTAGGDTPDVVVEGPLLVGNVGLLASSIGTGDLPDPAGAIVVLEDLGPGQWAVDRRLTQLIRSRWLTGAAGILVGDFSLPDPPELVEAMLRDRLLPLGVPVWSGVPAGHESRNLALPIGAQVRVGGGQLSLV